MQSKLAELTDEKSAMRFQVVLADLDTARVHLLRPPPAGSSHALQSPARHLPHPRLTPINSTTNTAAATATNSSGGQSAVQQASAQAQRGSRFTAVPVSLPEGSAASASVSASTPTFDPTPCYDQDVQELGGPAPLVLALLERLADSYNLVLPPELVRILLARSLIH